MMVLVLQESGGYFLGRKGKREHVPPLINPPHPRPAQGFPVTGTSGSTVSARAYRHQRRLEYATPISPRIIDNNIKKNSSRTILFIVTFATMAL